MTSIDIIWFRPNKLGNLAFENTNAFGFSDLWIQIVPLFYSRGEKEFLKKLCFVRSWEIFSEFREKYLVFSERIS